MFGCGFLCPCPLFFNPNPWAKLENTNMHNCRSSLQYSTAQVQRHIRAICNPHPSQLIINAKGKGIIEAPSQNAQTPSRVQILRRLRRLAMWKNCATKATKRHLGQIAPEQSDMANQSHLGHSVQIATQAGRRSDIFSHSIAIATLILHNVQCT